MDDPEEAAKKRSEMIIAKKKQKALQAKQEALILQNKLMSGFDMGITKSVGSFFADERHKAETGVTSNFVPSELMDGKQFVD